MIRQEPNESAVYRHWAGGKSVYRSVNLQVDQTHIVFGVNSEIQSVGIENMI